MIKPFIVIVFYYYYKDFLCIHIHLVFEKTVYLLLLISVGFMYVKFNVSLN